MKDLRKAFSELALKTGMYRVESWSTGELMEANAPKDRILWVESKNGEIDSLCASIVDEIVKVLENNKASSSLIQAVKDRFKEDE